MNGSLLTSERKPTHLSPTRPNCTERTGVPEGRRPGTARRVGDAMAGRAHRLRRPAGERPLPSGSRFASQGPTGSTVDGPLPTNRRWDQVIATTNSRSDIPSRGHFGVTADAGAVRDAGRSPRPAGPCGLRTWDVPGSDGGIHSRSSGRPTGLCSGFSPAANRMPRCFPGCAHFCGNELSGRVRSIQSDRTAVTGEPTFSTSHHLVPGLVKQSGQSSHASIAFRNITHCLPR